MSSIEWRAKVREIGQLTLSEVYKKYLRKTKFTGLINDEYYYFSSNAITNTKYAPSQSLLVADINQLNLELSTLKAEFEVEKEESISEKITKFAIELTQKVNLLNKMRRDMLQFSYNQIYDDEIQVSSEYTMDIHFAHSDIGIAIGDLLQFWNLKEKALCYQQQLSLKLDKPLKYH